MWQIGKLWRAFRKDPPGKRFKRGHDRLNRGRRGLAGRVLRLLLALVLAMIGLALVPLPGPGFIPLAAAAALVAGESRAVATLLDRAEVRVRGWLR